MTAKSSQQQTELVLNMLIKPNPSAASLWPGFTVILRLPLLGSNGKTFMSVGTSQANKLFRRR